MQQTAAQRYHFMDSARALCMLLGIPFHAALIYGAGGWRIDSPENSLFVEMIARAAQSFRMPTFFLIAGFFAAMMLTRGNARRWLGQRALRLWVPLVFGALLLNPVQIVAGVWGDVTIAPPDRLAAILAELSHPSALVAHLWFLAALFWLSAGLAVTWGVILPHLRGAGTIRDFLLHDRWGGALCLGGLLVWQAALLPALHRSGLPLYFAAGLVNIPAILTNAPWFLLGVVLFLDHRAFMAFVQPGRVGMALAAILMVVHMTAPEIAGLPDALRAVLRTLAGVCVSRGVLALLYRFANRETPVVRDLVSVSFTIYLLHQPVVVLLGLAFLAIAWPPVVEFALICAGCLAITWVIGRGVARAPLLRFMFNGVPPAGARRPRAVAPAIPAE